MNLETFFGARDSGKQSDLAGPARRGRSVQIDWELEAQKRRIGRSIHLALPAEATTTLALEIPRDWIPTVRVGRRRGPSGGAAAQSCPLGNRGRVGSDRARAFRSRSRGFAGGLGSLGFGDDAGSTCARRSIESVGPVNWSTDWLLELDPRNPKPLEVELDPGLELIEVEGPAVRGFRIEPSSGARRVIVTLGGELKSSDRGAIPGACSRA